MRLIDTHCHIMYGVDDGPDEKKGSLAMAAMAAAGGIGTVVATPHIVEGLYEGESRARQLQELQLELDAAGIDVRLLAGAEVPMSYCLTVTAARLGELSINGNGFLLMETAEATFQQLRRAAYQVRLLGLYPIFAHPERTSFVQEHPRDFAGMLTAGDGFCQVTAASLEGGFGKRVLRAAEELMDGGLVHLIASDAHWAGEYSSNRTPALSQCFELVKKKYGGETARLLLEENPEKVIQGEMPCRLPPADDGKARWVRLLKKGKHFRRRI